MSTPLQPPRRLRRRVRLLTRATLTLARVELLIRRKSTPALCQQFGVAFAAFDPPVEDIRPVPVDIFAAWWAVELVLRWWPIARSRPCLRRSLVLGHFMRWCSPALCLRVVSLDPFRAHAWLVVRGQDLDMGEARFAAAPQVPA